MTSPLLALFTRSLREDARAKLTYFARGGFVGFVLIFGLASGGFASLRGWGGAVGLEFFTMLIFLQMVCVTIAGIGFFASAITEEKEEQTLGLLRMTNLNPLSILLGKSTSRLCSVLLLLVAPLPFIVLAVTLGGVSLGQIGAAYGTLGAYTFFLCNLALFASVFTRTTSSAGGFTALGLLFFFSASSVVEGIFHVLGKLGWAAPAAGTSTVEALSSLTPIARLKEVLSTGFAGGPVSVQVVSNLLLGVGCFLLAWISFGACCDRALDGGAAGPARRRFLGLRFRRPARPWSDALAWKEFHFQTGGRPGLIGRIILYAVLTIAALVALARTDPTNQFAFASMWFVSYVSFVFTLDVAFMAARLFRVELRDQTFATIAMLPCPMRSLAWRKVRGCILAASPGAICMIVLAVPYLVLLTRMNDQPNSIGFVILNDTIGSWFGTLFLWCLVAFLSLFLKRGALPLGYILAQVVMVLFSIVWMAMSFLGGWASFGGMSPQFIFLGSMILYLLACVVLLRRMGPRLEALAGES